ncbi:glycoside hydrolase family 27 protein [Parvularcula dongshanensis]|uniref:Alpha-galactosidase n=1 Tax=Parvularcula dongshanensis TaxID=1173995 RepID=A0A840I2Z4_9PROT|nr:glycoside hydrolase family 27 protein [Parvularcula dongshanensis]MBB4658584.1 alpha-galactosidase [Parvularcula dongshanensis]
MGRVYKTFATVCASGLTALVLSHARAQKFEGVAETPPMGWNSWNHYGCDIDEDLIKQTADAIAQSGLRDAGYTYVNIDDCWHGERDEDGFIQADPERFPSGIKALADYVHERGLKIGLYSDAGRTTCGGKPGSQGHEYQDAKQYARWGIDYLKYDWCATGTGEDQRNPREAYALMRDALHAAGRPIVFSICEWGDNKPWEWGEDVGHLWRTTGDIINCWDCEVGHGNWFSSGILPILDKQAGLRAYAGPGHWNDPDMMEVGNLPALGENRAHFVMWAMLAAPLIIGTDVVNMDPKILEILTNEGVIAIDQDPLGIQGFPIMKSPDLEYWVKPLEGGDFAFAVLNRSDEQKRYAYDWAAHPVGDNANGWNADTANIRYTVSDLLRGRDVGTTETPLTGAVPAHDVVVFRMKKNG